MGFLTNEAQGQNHEKHFLFTSACWASHVEPPVHADVVALQVPTRGRRHHLQPNSRLTIARICLCSTAMADITLQALRNFSKSSSTMVTADAPLFGVVMILHGRVLDRGSQEADHAGETTGFPDRDHVVAEASRFWIQNNDGTRARKTRQEMAKLLREAQRAAGSS